jgi:hypothetical protein
MIPLHTSDQAIITVQTQGWQSKAITTLQLEIDTIQDNNNKT